ncbi:MAG: hypothetical protein JWO22_2007 [Frankiales bacterium]|nr:hypothetical protein [Frankiales bacterium]
MVGTMPDVAFKDLCLDTTRPDEVGPYWRDLLGLSGARQDGGDWSLTGRPQQRAVWVNTVPEPKTVKTRVHLDVRVDDHRGRERWVVRQDPAGLEWCAFGPGDALGPFELVVDAADPAAQAAWWAARTGGTVHNDGEPWHWVEGAAGFPYDYWVFQPVPEPKTVKNRMHWDVTLADGSVASLEAAGARVLDVLPSWTVMADPEGNEFCVFP